MSIRASPDRNDPGIYDSPQYAPSQLPADRPGCVGVVAQVDGTQDGLLEAV